MLCLHVRGIPRDVIIKFEREIYILKSCKILRPAQQEVSVSHQSHSVLVDPVEVLVHTCVDTGKFWLGASRSPRHDAAQLPYLTTKRKQQVSKVELVSNGKEGVEGRPTLVTGLRQLSGPPESPWHASLPLSPAQSIVSVTFLLSWP